MESTSARVFVIALTLAMVLLGPSHAQVGDETLRAKEEVLAQENRFWAAYNKCETKQLRTFFADDLEFYHDQGGRITGLDAFMKSIQTGICRSEDWRLRRQAVDGSPQVYLLRDNGLLYGAVSSGEHAFYVTQGGQESPSGFADFSHIWLKVDDEWQLSRVVSYAHRPSRSKHQSIKLSAEVLAQFEGDYEGTQMGKRTIHVSVEQEFLRLADGDFRADMYPRTEGIFYHRDRDLEFEFVRDPAGQVLKLVVRERGEVVEEAKRLR